MLSVKDRLTSSLAFISLWMTNNALSTSSRTRVLKLVSSTFQAKSLLLDLGYQTVIPIWRSIVIFVFRFSVKKTSFTLKENKSRSDMNDKWVFDRLNCFNLQNASNMKQNPHMIYVFNKKAFQKDAYRLLADHILVYPRPHVQEGTHHPPPQVPCSGLPTGLTHLLDIPIPYPRHTPLPDLWTEWLTDTCENITFPQLHWRAIKIRYHCRHYERTLTFLCGGFPSVSACCLIECYIMEVRGAVHVWCFSHCICNDACTVLITVFHHDMSLLILRRCPCQQRKARRIRADWLKTFWVH